MRCLEIFFVTLLLGNSGVICRSEHPSLCIKDLSFSRNHYKKMRNPPFLSTLASTTGVVGVLGATHETREGRAKKNFLQ